MMLYLAGNIGNEKWKAETDVPILESYFYINSEARAKIPKLKHFLLDSGAFTFFTKGKCPNFDKYVEEYAEFIKAYDIKMFFELDIDSLVGIEKVLQYRKRIEQIVGRQPIPVWHISRGRDRFIEDAKNYPYIALGGIVSGEWSAKAQNAFPWFIEKAHENGAKIHGLGYTSLEGIKKYHFDSVDSTAWTTGNRFGHVYKFNGVDMCKWSVPKGKKLKTQMVAQNNFDEWAKFSKYVQLNY